MLGSKKRKQKREQEEKEEEDEKTPAKKDREEGKKKENNPSNATDAVNRAREHLMALTGSECESITGFERTDDGWRIRGVVVEVNRIPPTTDILASYDVELDTDGEILKCQRVNRYWRSQAIAENSGNGDGYEGS